MVIFDSSLVTYGAVAADAGAAIEAVAAAGVRAGLFTPEYVAAVRAREIKFPTGLPTASAIGVAIPHATPTEEGQPASLSVARLTEPAAFGEMGSASGTVDVSLVFLLNVPGKDHLGLLSSLAGMFQDSNTMRRVSMGDEEVVVDEVKSALEAAGISVEPVR